MYRFRQVVFGNPIGHCDFANGRQAFQVEDQIRQYPQAEVLKCNEAHGFYKMYMRYCIYQYAAII